ncbi:MAG: hypothetical protein FRX48_03297 [Lasallia pustulata]|uniref:Uncharacterized protein n=1 Tax=Lasallia pustulata TaxID=136370 RepID=A0A5M8PWT0_9LECA|nr:MAG: hypothetical protein FRX48_03297 [Lasallia pustulata]
MPTGLSRLVSGSVLGVSWACLGLGWRRLALVVWLVGLVVLSLNLILHHRTRVVFNITSSKKGLTTQHLRTCRFSPPPVSQRSVCACRLESTSPAPRSSHLTPSDPVCCFNMK